MGLEMSQLGASPGHWEDTGCREELHQRWSAPQEQPLLLLSCNKRQGVIEGPSAGQQQPGATSCLSPAPGQDSQEVTGTAGQQWGTEGWWPPGLTVASQGLLPAAGAPLCCLRCHPKGHLITHPFCPMPLPISPGRAKT